MRQRTLGNQMPLPKGVRWSKEAGRYYDVYGYLTVQQVVAMQLAQLRKFAPHGGGWLFLCLWV
jgi:hypothetical protein